MDEAATPTGELDPELEEAANQFFNSQTESPEGGEGAGSEPSGSVGSDPQPSPDEWSWDDGFKLSKDQARSYAELEAYLYSNPDKVQALAQILSGDTSTTTTTPSSSGESEGSTGAKVPAKISLDDVTDPEVRQVLEIVQEQQQELERLRGMATGVNDYVTVQQEQTAQSLANRAFESFKTEHNLSDDEIELVSTVAARLQVLPSLMSPVDPITGKARRVDPLAAIEDALNIAYWQIPSLRDRAISNEVDNSTRNKARKQKLSSLQGSSGSVPREAPVAKTEQDRRSQMIQEVAGMMERDKS